MNNRKKNIFIFGFILLTTLLLTYSNHFKNGFHFDDYHAIVENVHIRNLKNIPEFFTNPKMFSSKPDHWGLRPIVTTSLAIDYFIGKGLDPFYFHLSTFLWYLVLCILIFFLFKKLFYRSIQHQWAPYFALFASGWYALHTVNAETINYIISRSDVLSTVFIVMSVSIYISYPKLRKRLIYIIPAIIGVFTKETMVVIPIILFFYILIFEKEQSFLSIFKRTYLKTNLRIVISLLPLVITIFILQLYTLSQAHSESGFSNPLYPYLITQPYIWLHYFYSFFFPFNLSADSDWGVISNIFDDRVLTGFIFLIVLVWIIQKTTLKKSTRPIAFGLLWFLTTLLPTSIVPLADVTNDHRMFLPFIGLMMAVVWLLGILCTRYENKLLKDRYLKILLIFGATMIPGIYAYGTYNRNEVWKNGETLWYDVTLKSPKNGRGLMNYGLSQMEKGNYQTAISYYQKALPFTPYYPALHINMAIAQNAIGEISKAEAHFKNAINYGSNIDQTYYFYARFLYHHGRFEEAKNAIAKADSIAPYNLNTKHLMLEIYDRLKLWPELQKAAEKTLEISENDSIALKYKKSKENKNDSNYLNEAIKKAETDPSAENFISLSLLYYQKGEYENCIAACYKALELNPNSEFAYNNICSAYNSLKMYQKSIEACRKAISINPEFQIAKNNLEYAQKQSVK